eukprot:GDKJ01055974.1.p1 GENE.GDKJ01055974.1~~GDKJ01055974.1.p1  ORF type:complete len:381 (+),score=100.93 GDKJ01055974.1:21-1163(+)
MSTLKSSSSSNGSKVKSSTNKIQALSSILDNSKFMFDFMFDLTIPAQQGSLKMMDTPIDFSDILRPLSSFEVKETAGGVVTDSDGPLLDLINPKAFVSRDDVIFTTNEELLEDIDPLKKAVTREILGLRAPTYLAVEFTADELQEAGRGGAQVDLSYKFVPEMKTYTIEEHFTRDASTYSHPMKANVVAEEVFQLLPDPELFSKTLIPFVFEADPIKNDIDLVSKINPSDPYPRLVLQPLEYLHQKHHVTCQLYAELPALCPPKNSLELGESGEALISQCSANGMNDMHVMKKLRTFQGYGDMPTNTVVSNSLTAKTTDFILVSMPRRRPHSNTSSTPNDKAALITPLCQRIGLTKGNTTVQSFGRQLNEVMVVVERFPL